MTKKISKGNVSLASRLDEIRMSEHERIRAKAQLARAEAIADLLAGAARGIAGLFKSAPTGARTAANLG